MVNFKRKIIIALGALSFMGCFNSPSPTKTDNNTNTYSAANARKQYETNLAKWNHSGLVNYSFLMNMDCFCDPAGMMVVEVKSSKVENVTLLDYPDFNPDQNKNVMEINGLFNEIHSYLDNPNYTVKVTYDASYGYPTEIFLNQVEQLPDGDLHVVVSDFLKVLIED